MCPYREQYVNVRTGTRLKSIRVPGRHIITYLTPLVVFTASVQYLLCFRKYADKQEKEEDYREAETEVALQTAVEAEDLWDEELNSFKPASRNTSMSLCIVL